MKNMFFSILLFCTALSMNAQLLADDLKPFIPKGYKVLFQYDADLNLDSLKDKIIVLGTDRSIGDSTLRAILPAGTNLQKRPVLILLRQVDKSLKRVTRNDEAVAQALANIDPFTQIKCGSGNFTIEHTVNEGSKHCTISARFEWVKKQSDWYLKIYSHACIFTTVDSGTNDEGYKEKTPKNFGKIPFGKYKYPMEIEIDEWGQ
jgi:hypothetical protein